MNTKQFKFSFYVFAMIGAILTLALLATAAFAGGVALAPQLNSTAQAAPAVQSANPATDDMLAAYENALTGIYDTALPSVVEIVVTQKVERDSSHQFNFDFGPSGPRSQQQPDNPYRFGQGSGFVWDTEGHIVTNYHVVKNADSVEVIFADGARLEAKVLGGDPDADLAVLQVEEPAGGLKPLPLGDSDSLQPGHLTIAIGTPFGQDFSMTSGIVSAVGRTIRSGNSSYSIPEVIQTDAAINPGNSGGPLLNRHGEVIGINTMIISQSGSNAGIGFAVPINIAQKVVPTLIKGQDYEYAWLGISGTTLSTEAANEMGLPADTTGALVISVAQDSPADKAGLRGSDKTLTIAGREFPFGGDVITAIDGQAVGDMDDLIAYLVEQLRPGDKADLTIIRDGQSETVTVTLGSRPNN